MTSPTRRPAPGFTLPELLVTLTVFGIVMAAAVGFFQAQNRAFQSGTQRLDILQNTRYSLGQLEHLLRTVGMGTVGDQPMLVYGHDNVIAFNSDYTENDTTDFRWAVNFNPTVPNSQALAWDAATATTIPLSTYIYPPQTFRMPNGSQAPAETIIFYFQLDTDTPRGDDYALYQQVNADPPELVARNILPYPGRPFFEYLMRRRSGGGDTIMVTPAGLLPLIRRPLSTATNATDSANYIRPDSVRAVRVNLRVTNGLSGSDERYRDVSSIVSTPNNGLPHPNVCGRSPFAATGFTAIPDPVGGPGSGRVELTWTPSIDETGGERDVWQYVVYSRPSGGLTWDDPVAIIQRDTLPIYTFAIGGYTPGATYEFAVAAQDCTPALSSLVTSTVVAP